MKPLKTPTSPFWKNYDFIGNKGVDREWGCECTYCGRKAFRTTRQINQASPKCPCLTTDKTKVTFTINGETRPLSHWMQLHPEINEKSARRRKYQRDRGEDLTDEEVLFGKRVTRIANTDQVVSEASDMVASFTAKLVQSVQKEITSLMGNDLQREVFRMLRDRNSGANTRYLLGNPFVLESTLMISISELLSSGYGTDEIEAFLREERFENLEEKRTRLQGLIPVDTTLGDRLTDSERLCLLSVGHYPF